MCVCGCVCDLCVCGFVCVWLYVCVCVCVCVCVWVGGWMYEESSIQRLSLLVTESCPSSRAIWNWTLPQIPLRLRSYSRSHDIPIELLYWQILTTVGPEFQELSSVRESLDNNKRKMNTLIKKCVRLKNSCRRP